MRKTQREMGREKNEGKKKFVPPKIQRMEKLHQVARFGVSGAPGLQTIGVAS